MMLNTLFYENEKKENVIVPIEIFQKTILDETGLLNEELLTKDMGEIESIVNIVPKQPNELKSIKRGKSRNTLYRFRSNEDKMKSREIVTNLIR